MHLCCRLLPRIPIGCARVPSDPSGGEQQSSAHRRRAGPHRDSHRGRESDPRDACVRGVDGAPLRRISRRAGPERASIHWHRIRRTGRRVVGPFWRRAAPIVRQLYADWQPFAVLEGRHLEGLRSACAERRATRMQSRIGRSAPRGATDMQTSCVHQSWLCGLRPQRRAGRRPGCSGSPSPPAACQLHAVLSVSS